MYDRRGIKKDDFHSARGAGMGSRKRLFERSESRDFHSAQILVNNSDLKMVNFSLGQGQAGWRMMPTKC